MGTPRLELAEKVLPKPLLKAIRHIFSQGIGKGAWLVGGTALAGYYAGHRRSDDIDLFTASDGDQRAGILAVESLASIGAVLKPKTRSAQFYRASAELDGHHFIIDVALHAHLHAEGKGVALEDGVVVADFESLEGLKAAALVSRCGEKDLFDALWLIEHSANRSLEEFVQAALRFDAGADAEGLIAAAGGAIVSKEACGFSETPRDEVARQLERFRKSLIRGLKAIAQKEKAPPIAELLRRVKKLSP